MKAIISLLGFIISIAIVLPAEGQILKRLKERVEQTAADKVVNKAGNATENTMDKAEASMKKKKSDKPEEKDEKGIIILTGKEEDGKSQPTSTTTLQAFKNYDFVAGDKVIYFYDMAEEADAEIPGRMLLQSGSMEVQTYQGEKVLNVPVGGAVMMPLMKEESYLPEQFTLEFDILSNGGLQTTTDMSEITLYFREKGNTEGNATAPLRISLQGASGDNAYYALEMFNKANNRWLGGMNKFPQVAVSPKQNNWRHVAIYVNKNIGKLYMDQHRLGVVNQIETGEISKIEIEVANDQHAVLFKNFRLAAGGSDSYKKVMTDGKFIAYGIQFDVNKATLKPESMGTINEFAKMMKENPDLKFEIGGHTDTDGTIERNNTLSAERANAVKAQMISMGIEGSRLTAKGYGSSNPVAANDIAENKAKNRRVEFVKIK